MHVDRIVTLQGDAYDLGLFRIAFCNFTVAEGSLQLKHCFTTPVWCVCMSSTAICQPTGQASNFLAICIIFGSVRILNTYLQICTQVAQAI